MNRYMEFNAIKFIRDSVRWGTEKEALLKRLEEITEIQAVDPATVSSGSGISDSVPTVAISRTAIEESIERLDLYINAYKFAFSHLAAEEQDAINAFFFSTGGIHHAAHEVCRKYGINYPRGIYTLRREALQHFSRLIEDNYF